MDLEYGERYEAFRSEVREFLEKHKPERQPMASRGDAREALVDWLTKQIEHGYWARTIPKKYGGYGADPDLLETVIMDEEFNRAGASRGMMGQGPSMLVPTLLRNFSSRSTMASSRFLTCASNGSVPQKMALRLDSWTLRSPRTTTGRKAWRRRPPRATASIRCRRMAV